MLHSLPRRLCAPSLARPIACAPHRLRAPSLVLLLFGMMASLLLAAPNVHAGSYVGAYTDPVSQAPSPCSSGTHYTVTGNPSPGVYTFGNVADAVTNGTYGGASTGNGVPGQGIQSDCSGAISTSWNWVPASGLTMATDPPPSQVVIMQTCTVAVGMGVPATANYNTGLTNLSGQSGTPPFHPPTSTGGSGSGTYYFVQPGGATVSLPALNAVAHVSMGNSSASVSYSAAISPVFVIPTSAIKDSSGNYNILIGQGLTAGLSSIPPALLNNAANLPTYSWSVHGTTFQAWKVAADGSSAVLLSGSGPLNQATAHWYWNEAATTETVSCTVTLTPPVGQGSAFPVTPSVQVAVADPSYNCAQTVGQSFVTADGTTLKARGASQAYPRGDSWYCNVQTPALFGSGGSCNFCQLITPSRSHTYSSGTVPCSQNGIQGVDTSMPYPSLPASMSDGDPYTVGSGTTNGWPADNSQHHTGDSPSTLLVSNNYGVASVVSIGESYSTTLMYTPPGPDAQPVALHELDWKWTATATEPPTGWATQNGFTVGTVTANGTMRVYPQPTWPLIESPSVGSGW